MKRKKRAEKSIKSLQKTIGKHELKREKARKENKKELVEYYDKEIVSLKRTLSKKEEIANK